MTKKSVMYFLGMLFMAFNMACSSDNNQNKDAIMTADDSVALTKDTGRFVPSHKFDMVISDIPFPFEILDNLYSKQISFNQNAMNSLANTAKYNQYNSKALNLGIYGADLAYVVTYEQFQQIGPYIKNTKKLAEDLNIPYAFDQDMMDKYTKFKDNKDSLTKIVYASYNQVDKALKNDERVGMAALVVTGSWLEGLYLSSKTFLDEPKTPENSSLYKVIGHQKQSLLIVIKLLDEYKKDPYIAGLINDLKEITSEYNITSDNNMNEKQLISINNKVEKLRSRITEGL